MEENGVEIFRTLLSIIPSAPEFWSAIVGAIVGAVVGGLIAYMVQVKALHEGRKQRDEDHKRLWQALGNALLFKMMRLHSNFHGIQEHFEESFASAAQRKDRMEPWQFVLPLANPPDSVNFSSEEMGMLLSLKNDDVFNLVLSMDVIHNSLIDAVKVLNTERRALTERITAEEADGAVLSSNLDRDQMMALRPRMIEVNGLIDSIRDHAKRGFKESGAAMYSLHNLLRDELEITYNLESKVKPNDPSPR